MQKADPKQESTMPSVKKRRLHFTLCGFAFSLVTTLAQGSGGGSGTVHSLTFDSTVFRVRSATINQKIVRYRAYEGIVYVKQPVDDLYQIMNIYTPVEYYEGKSVGPYSAETAPIFLFNSVGGYMPGLPGAPGQGFDAQTSTVLTALARGYVVAAPGTRGRTCADASGNYSGKAPAAIVDLKAAVRYLRANDKRMPGNAERIISNGTSAGGALSSLLGATGNHPDYEPYLRGLGAAEGRDDVFAVSAYCPITNLENADIAYEWLFCGLDVSGRNPMPMGAPPVQGGFPGRPGHQEQMPPHASLPKMSASQVEASKLLKARFPSYLNSLGLKDRDGKALTLDSDGNGSFKDYIKSLVIDSAQRALSSGKDLSGLPWVKIQSGKVVDIDFEAYVRFAGRMKATTAFDGLDLGTGENSLFGTRTVNAQHFTRFGLEYGTAKGRLADPAIVRLMNPMNFIGTREAATAHHWRIRHGAIDRDTSLAIPAILATRLENTGTDVDFALPWGQGHGGDYDLEELFAWVDRICR